MGVWSNTLTTAFFIGFIVTVFLSDIVVVVQLCPLKMLPGTPMVIFKKMFRQCGTSQGQTAFTTKYPNFLFFISLFFSTASGHNFDQTVARNLHFCLESVWLKKVMPPMIKISFVK